MKADVKVQLLSLHEDILGGSHAAILGRLPEEFGTRPPSSWDPPLTPFSPSHSEAQRQSLPVVPSSGPSASTPSREVDHEHD